jgi:hypothetical protein
MHHAAKRKTQFTASLAAVRLLLLLVVAFCGLETRVWSFAAPPQPASGEIALATPSFIGENYDGFAYDASDSLVAAKGGQRLLTAGTDLPNAGGVIRSFVQESDQVYYRVFSGDRTVGSFLTATPPRSGAWAQEALSLPPGNTAQYIQEVLVPAGTRLQRSRALAVPEWGRFRGGAEQFQLLEHIPVQNFGPGRALP